VVFLLSIIGYLVLLIVYKWLAYDASQSSCAPTLLIGERLIQLCLLIGRYINDYANRSSCLPTF